MIPAHPRYTSLPNANKLYTAICCALSSPLPQADFASFDDSDWPLFLRMTQTERVAPLLYKALQNTPHVPDHVRESLHQSYLHTAARNTLLFHELDRVLQALDEANIPVVVLKGAALAQSLYGDIGLRPMGDLDLLVPAPRLDEATRRVMALGYEHAKPEIGHGLTRLINYHIWLRSQSNPAINVELHHSLVSTPAFRYYAPVDWFWDQAEEFRSGVLTLNPTAHLLFLAAHLMLQHGYDSGSLLWLVDIDRVVTTELARMDWKVLFLKAEEMGWAAAVRKALLVANCTLGTAVPEELLEQLGMVERQVEVRLIALKSQPASTRMLSQWRKLASLSLNTRVRLILALVFPSWGYMRWRYGLRQRWQILVYYPMRWVDVLRDGFSSFRADLFYWENH